MFNDDFVVDWSNRRKTRVGEGLFITLLSRGIRSTLAAAYKHEERPMRGARVCTATDAAPSILWISLAIRDLQPPTSDS